MLSKLKVLVLDDHAYQCALLKDMLEEAGFPHVDTALDAHDALDRSGERNINWCSWMWTCPAWTVRSSFMNSPAAA